MKKKFKIFKIIKQLFKIINKSHQNFPRKKNIYGVKNTKKM